MNDLDIHEELARLRQWKAEASEVMIGLQDLGRALDLPPGTRITGELAAEKARKLTREVERLKGSVGAFSSARDAAKRGWQAANEKLTEMTSRAEAAEAELRTLRDRSPYITCRCGRTIYLVTQTEVTENLAALADRMETADYNSLADGWGCIAAAEIRHELGLEPECRCPSNTNPATDRTKP